MGFMIKPLLRRPLMPLLVVLQVALACAIACNALFLLQQKLGPVLAPDGVRDPSHVLVLWRIAAKGQPWPAARVRAVQAELRAVPGVESATYAATFPMITNAQMTAGVVGADPHAKVSAGVYMGDNLLDTLGLRLVAGRDFTPGEKSVNFGSDLGFNTDGPAIITRGLAQRLFPGKSALGQLIRYSNSPRGARTVVGVVAHLMRNKFTRSNRDLDYAMLFPGVAAQWPIPIFAVRIRAPGAAGPLCKPLLAVIQREFGPRMLPGMQVQCDSFASLRNRMMAQPRAAVWLLAGVTLIVLIVTLTGIMGMTAYWVQQRTHSIGIRRALGARRIDVLRELLVENLFVVGAGVVVGLIAAYGINLWLMRHYELLRLPVVYLPAGAVLLLALGQLAVLAPARRASNIPPIVATRAA